MQKMHFWLIGIVLLGTLLRVHLISDNHLHTWDEQYHALVAKNLSDHPLTPTLIDNPILPYDYKNWVGNHIWLEKGPVPLHAIALSLKIFGTTPWAVRIPSLLLSILGIIVMFQLGRLLFNKNVGLIAAFLFAIHGMLIEAAVGRVSSDHVEFFFIFFILLSVYLTVWILKNQKKYAWFILVGLATCMAVLSKWFPALIIAPIILAGFWVYTQPKWKNLLIISFYFLLGFLPFTLAYFIYCYTNYPTEFLFVFKKFIFAFNDTVEYHNAPWWYYIHKTGILFGEFVYFALIVTITHLFKVKNKQLLLTVVWIFIPLLIFSFAETKRFTYLLIAAPAFFLITAYIIDYIRTESKWNTFLGYFIVLLLIGLPIRYCFERMKFFSEPVIQQWSKNIQELNTSEWKKKTVVFNVEHNIQAMFYHDFTFYDFVPNEEQLKMVKDKGYDIVINNIETEFENKFRKEFKLQSVNIE